MDRNGLYARSSVEVDAVTNSATNTELVAAPGAGKSIVVDRLVVSMAAAGNFFLEADGDSDTVIFPTTYLAANTSFATDLDLKLPVNEALDITTSITGNWSAYVEYHIEGR